jgi:hypothetical protein
MTEAWFISQAQRDAFHSPKLFEFVFGRKPKSGRDRPFLTNYLTNLEKVPPEQLEHLLELGLTSGQIEAIYETGIVPCVSDFNQYGLHPVPQTPS